MSDSRFHALPPNDIVLPSQFTYPFAYQPHPIALLAVQQLQSYLEEGHLPSNFGIHPPYSDIGKMFGVLVVKNRNQEIGFLAAFSGKIGNLIINDYFTPPIYNTLDTNGRYKIEEIALNDINQQIAAININPTLLALRAQKIELETALILHKKAVNTAQKQRQEARKNANSNDEATNNALKLAHEKESFQLRIAYKDHAARVTNELALLDSKIDNFEQKLAALKQARKEKSSEVQTYLFENYHFLNAKDETKNALALFAHEIPNIPPSGTGECAAPKLLQYAYQHKYQPIALAEFWWGKTPSSENRTHQTFYPACTAKCKPVLTFMLEGLNVMQDPRTINYGADKTLEILYDDADLTVICKPEGLLSVPGKLVEDSVYTRYKQLYPDADGSIIVHRLDMSTSGIMLLTKNATTHKHLQEQFAQHTIEKRYEAILEGSVQPKEGWIDLSLRVDVDNRPHQMVCETYGKPARTRYKVIFENQVETLIHFWPQTGRTHQLRMHASSILGLNAPIKGDELYGKVSHRLYLHAAFIQFTHPTTGQTMHFNKPSGFKL